MYSHKVQYYETDKMGITHHSNYIRWMEESRINYMEELGYGYEKMEAEDIISPVIAVNANYKKTTTFPDVVSINVSVAEFSGVKLKIHYEMKNQNDELVFEGESMHCFLNAEGKPIRMKKEFPDLYQLLLDELNKSGNADVE